MPFGCTNPPATFQEMMARIFKDEEGCIWCMDDILMYSGTTAAEHRVCVVNVLQPYVNHGLEVNPTKSEFHVHETIFIGHMLNGSQVQIHPVKV